MQRSCTIFFYDGYIGVAPTIVGLAESLRENGFYVEIQATRTKYPGDGILSEDISVVYFSRVRQIQALTRVTSKLRRMTSTHVFSWIDLVFVAFQSLRSHTSSRSIGGNRRINIGVDTFGALLALVHKWLFGESYVYLSLEVDSPSRFGWLSSLGKRAERCALKNARSVVIQDQARFDTLSKYAGYRHPQVFYLPNAPIAANADAEASDGNFLRNRLGISGNQFPYIALQAGMIGDQVHSKELARGFRNVNVGCALVLHERKEGREHDPYIKSLYEINSRNLFLSLRPVPLTELGLVVRSATIGLAFYTDSDPNFEEIALASGKLAYYLKYGKPVIVSDSTSLRSMVDKYNIGAVVSDPSSGIELSEAIQNIIDNYNVYSRNAFECFREEYAFDRNIKPIINMLIEEREQFT